MIETALYYLLASTTAITALVGDRLFPVTPTRETQVPFAVYQITAADPQLSLGGPTGLSKYTLTIDAYGINESTVLSVLATVRETLNGYAGDPIQGIFPGNYTSQVEETGYHANQTYTVWAVG